MELKEGKLVIKVITGSVDIFNNWARKRIGRLTFNRIGMSKKSSRGEQTFTIFWTRDWGISWTLTNVYRGAPYYLIQLVKRRGDGFDTMFLGFIHERKMPKEFLRTIHEVMVFLGLEEEELEEQEDAGGSPGTQIFDVATYDRLKSKPIKNKWKEKKK